MNIRTQADIAEINRRGREIVSREENDAHRHIEDVARAIRLRHEALIYAGLRLLQSKVESDNAEVTRIKLYVHTLGAADDIAELREALKPYDYLARVPPEAFKVR